MLAHASTHSTNFDENTTATVFSFSVIAYQWGWNYYFPRDIVEVLASAPSTVGHKRVTNFTSVDQYSALLAQAKHEYYSRLNSTNQLVAKHGKYTLNQFLQAAFVGSRATKEHAWLATGLVPALDYSQLKVSQFSQATLSNLGALNPDVSLAMSKDVPLASNLLNLDLYRSNNILTLLANAKHRALTTTNLGLSESLFKQSLVSDASYKTYANNVRAHAFSNLYNKVKGGINPFRAHNTAVFVGNRLARIHDHLTSGSMLPSEFNTFTKQSHFIHGLYRNVAGKGAGSQLTYSALNRDTKTSSLHSLMPENVGINLWLTRGFGRIISAEVQPWALAAFQQSFAASTYSVYKRNPHDSFFVPSTVKFAPSPISTQLGGLSPLRSSVAKTTDYFGLTSEGILSKFTSKYGNADLSKYAQHFFFSGEDMTLSGGESQRTQISDIAGLSPNSASELGNLVRTSLKGAGVSAVGQTSNLSLSSGGEQSFRPLLKLAGIDFAHNIMTTYPRNELTQQGYLPKPLT